MANNLARVFLGNGNNTEKKAYVWNTLNGVVFAAQSVLMLMIITRVSDLATAGVFSIAYSTASMLMNMGLYGMRYFQVSDYDRIYSFREYVTSRKVTTWAMIIVGAGYMLVMALTGQYTAEKAAIVMLMTVFKALDAIEDVYTADYQNCGRLDAGAKMVTIRLLFSLVVFGAALMITRSLLVTLAITNILSYGYVIVAVKVMAPHFKKEEETKERGKVKKLLLVCFPLFAAQFLSLYLTNAPKYSIDALLSEEIQACYGFLSMPVFIVGLLSNFIFQPIITNMSEAWSQGRYKDLRKIVMRQTGIIGMLAAALLIGGYFLGLPVLSWLYHTDLSGYLPELMILLAGGGLMALSRYFVTVVTVMRRQKMITVGYLVTSVAALLLSNAVVRQYGITGACVVYTGSMLLLTVILVVIAFIFTRGGVEPSGGDDGRTIRSKADYRYFCQCDTRAAKREGSYRKARFIARCSHNYEFLCTLALRKFEYILNCKKGPVGKIRLIFAKRKFYKYCVYASVFAQPNTIGPGVYIPHGNAVISGFAALGKNCMILSDVTIGVGREGDDAPTIGNNVYIGSGAKLIGGITIADDVVIGANAVVVRDVTDKGVTVAGIPAKKISSIGSEGMLVRAAD